MNWRRMLAVLWLCQPACQAELPPTTPATARVPGTSSGAHSELRALLAAVPPAEPVLGALSSEQRAEFDRLLSGLSEPELEALRSDTGAIALERPLLHLMAGGRSQLAMYSLATTQSAANELMGIRPSAEQLPEVLETTNEVIVRAASEWMRLARERVEQGPAPDVGFCEQLDQVAGVLAQKRLRFAARELWAKLDDSAAARLNLARAALWVGESQQAKDELAKVRERPQPDPMTQRFAAQIAELVTTFEALSTPATTLAEAVSHARGYLLMADHKAARGVLVPYAEQRAQHLELATTSLIAHYTDLPCAGVVAGLGNARLCAFANQRGPLSSADFKLVEQAWQSGRGRSAQSVEDYLGLVLIIPWRSQLDQRGDPKQSLRHGRELSLAAQEAEQQFQEFAGIALMSRAMVAGLVELEPSAGPSNSSVLDALEQETAELIKLGSGGQRDAAAALAAVLVLAQHRDARALYRSLPRPGGVELALEQVVLGAWLAAAFRDAQLFEEVKAHAIEVLGALSSNALESSELVLLLAEAATLIEGSENNQRTLEQVSQELARAGVPAELAARALLQRSRLLSVQGKAETAAALLREHVQRSTDVGGGRGREPMQILLRARLSLFDTESESADTRLDAWRRVFADGDWPPSMDSWRQRWQAEFRWQSAKQQCQNRAPCLQKAERAKAEELLAARRQLTATAQRLAERGVVSLGSLEISIDYRPLAGLRAVVRSNPALIPLPEPGQNP